MTATIKNPQPGYYTFTDRHCSITRVTGDKPRLVPKDANRPSVEELQEGNHFQGQFGEYDVKGNTLTLRPLVARNPGTMRAGNTSTGTFNLDGTILTLAIKNGEGQTPTVKLTRVK